MNLDDYIPLECCNKHFLHPDKLKIYSKHYNKFIQPMYADKSYRAKYPAFNLHNEVFSSARLKKIQERYRRQKLYGHIEKPEVVHL